MKNNASVTIDGTEYPVTKLKFKGQLDFASIIAEMFKGMMINTAEGGGVNIDIGDLLTKFPDKASRLLSVGLDLPLEEVENFSSGRDCMLALKKILEVNPVNDILGESMTLFSSIKLS